MDVLNYENAVSAYNNLEQFQSEKQQQLKDLVLQYKEGAEQALLPAIELYQRGRGLYNKLGSQAESAISDGENAVSGAVEGIQGVASSAIEGAQSALSSGADSIMSGITSKLGEFSSGIRGIGNDLSNRMMSNAFERDPESEIASGSENMGFFDRVQSVFRGGVSDGESIGNISRSAVSEGTSAITSAAEGVGTAVAEGVGAVVADSIPVVGEIGMLGLGIYDLVKGETTRAPVVQAFAAPVFEKGV